MSDQCENNLQELVRQELDSVFQTADQPCTKEEVGRLKYLDCCMKETMRLHPPIPVIQRTLSETIELGGYTVPAGTSVEILFYAMHHDEKHFSEPLRFKPERFMEHESHGRHPYSFVPFSAGPRNCIGILIVQN